MSKAKCRGLYIEGVYVIVEAAVVKVVLVQAAAVKVDVALII